MIGALERLASLVRSLSPASSGLGYTPVVFGDDGQDPGWPGVPDGVRGSEWTGDQFATIYPRAAALIPPIFASISKLSGDVAGLPIIWERQTGASDWEPLEEGHWIPALFSDGNPSYSGYEVMRDLQAGLDVSGTSLLFADPRGDSVPRELWHVPYHMAAAIAGPYRSIRGYRWLPSMRVLEATDITPFRYWNPNWETQLPGPEGLSPLSAARMAFETRAKLGKLQRGLFGRGTQVQGMFTPDGPEFALKEGEAKKIQKRLSRMAGDGENFNDPVIVSGLKQVRPPILPKDLLFLEMMGAADKDIFMIYGIPPAIMGIKESGSLSAAGMDSDMLLYDTGPLTQRAELLGRVITDQFCRRWDPSVRCRLDLSGRLSIAKAKLAQLDALTRGAGRPVLTLNSALRSIHEATVSDQAAHADDYVVPFNVMLSGDLDAPQPASVVPGMNDGQPPSGSAKGPGDQLRRLGRYRSEGRKRALRRWRDADLSRYERQVARWATSRFSVQEERMVARARAVNSGQGKAFARTERFAEGDEYDLEGPNDWKEAQTLFEAIIADRGEAAAAEIGEKIALDVHRGRLADLIARRSHDVITNLDKTTSDLLRQALAESVAANENLDQLVGRMRAVFDNRRANAETISRTETAWAYNTASVEAWKESGVQFKSWLTAEDSSVRPTHTECESVGVLTMGETFPNGLMYPGDPSGGPEEVCNCRCTLQPEFNAAGADPGDGGDVGARLRARALGNGHAQRWPEGLFNGSK